MLGWFSHYSYWSNLSILQKKMGYHACFQAVILYLSMYRYMYTHNTYIQTGYENIGKKMYHPQLKLFFEIYVY